MSFVELCWWACTVGDETTADRHVFPQCSQRDPADGRSRLPAKALPYIENREGRQSSDKVVWVLSRFEWCIPLALQRVLRVSRGVSE